MENKSPQFGLRWKRVATLVCSGLMSMSAFEVKADKDEVLPLALSPSWKVFLNVEAPKTYESIPSTLPAAGGNAAVTPKTATMSGDAINLGVLAGGFEQGAGAVLYNEFQAPRAGTVKAGASADYWMEIHVNGEPVLSTMKAGNGGSDRFTANDHVFTFPVKEGKNLLAARVKSGSGGWSFVCGTPEAAKPNVKFVADDEWKPVDLSDLKVKPGSALDRREVSELPRNGADGRLPRLTIGPKGGLVAADELGAPIRLNGADSNTPWIFGRARKDPNWKETWKKEAVAARLRGYNLIRLHPSTICPEDMTITPDMLDKFDYFVGEFGKNGVYTFLSLGAFMRCPWTPSRADERRDWNMRMYLGDPLIRKAWKFGTESLMNHVNPYTGLAWKDDPSIACVEFMGEQEWAFYHPKSRLDPRTQAEFDAKYRSWIQAKYGDVKALAQAWNEPSLTSFDQVAAPATFPNGGSSVKDNDYILFCQERFRANSQWMNDTLRATGYQGLAGQYAITYFLAGQEVKWTESQVDLLNTYFCHPSSFSKPGSNCGQKSSISTRAGWIRDIMSTRFADRPFIVPEYNHAFWNPYQHECGALFSAYFAFQGLDALIIHGMGVFDYAEKPGLDVFSVAHSPVVQANQFLASCLYLRGDVKRSPRRIELQIPQRFVEVNGNGGRNVSREQAALALLTGFGVAFPWAKPAVGVPSISAPDLTLEPVGSSEFKSAGGGWAVEGVDAEHSKFSLDAAVANMKRRGILPQDNLSQPSKGVFQSDTGEITIRSQESLLKVATPRSEAVTLESGKGEPVGQLTVVATSVPALVAACAIDKAPLADSKRIVLIYSTQVANTDMELSADRSTLVNLGKPPVLMRVGKLNVALRNANGAQMSLYALGLNGARQEKLPLKFENGQLQINLDTATLKNGPTSFFELATE